MAVCPSLAVQFPETPVKKAAQHRRTFPAMGKRQAVLGMAKDMQLGIGVGNYPRITMATPER